MRKKNPVKMIKACRRRSDAHAGRERERRKGGGLLNWPRSSIFVHKFSHPLSPLVPPPGMVRQKAPLQLHFEPLGLSQLLLGGRLQLGGEVNGELWGGRPGGRLNDVNSLRSGLDAVQREDVLAEEGPQVSAFAFGLWKVLSMFFNLLKEKNLIRLHNYEDSLGVRIIKNTRSKNTNMK